MQCVCCGEEFSRSRRGQIYKNSQHRQKDKNRRWPVKRQSVLRATSSDVLGERWDPETSGVTPLQVAQSKRECVKEQMGKKASHEFLSPVQVGRLLGISRWSLLLWRKKGFGPPFLRITRGTIRYPRLALIAWLNSLPRN